MTLRLRIDGTAPESATRARERDTVVEALAAPGRDVRRGLASSSTAPSNGKLEADSINEGITSTATQAAAAVLQLRQREGDILQLSNERAYGDGTTIRQDEAAVLEAEIGRITSTATYNDVNVLAGRTLTLNSKNPEINDAIGLASFASAITTSARFSNQTPTNAASDLEVIKDSVQSIASLISSYESASKKSDQSGEPDRIGFDTRVPSALRDQDEAQELARKIAASVISPYATERQRLALIEMSSNALSEDTVTGLVA